MHPLLKITFAGPLISPEVFERLLETQPHLGAPAASPRFRRSAAPKPAKQVSLAYYIKSQWHYHSRPEEDLIKLCQSFVSGDDMPVYFDGTPIEFANAVYLEMRRKQGAQGFLFPTPFDVADQMADLADIQPGEIVFDPGAGIGNLLAAAEFKRATAHGCDIQHWLGNSMKPLGLASVLRYNIVHADFLEEAFRPDPFHVILTNPPYGKSGDHSDLISAFLSRIADLSTPDTRIVALLPCGYLEKTRPKFTAETIARFRIRRTIPVRADAFRPLTNLRTEIVQLNVRP